MGGGRSRRVSRVKEMRGGENKRKSALELLEAGLTHAYWLFRGWSEGVP